MADKKKMTIVEKYTAIQEMLGGTYTGEYTAEEAIKFLGERIAQTTKKNTANANGEKKLTPEQEANEVIKEKVLEVLATATEPMSLADLMTIEGVKSNQHISSLVTQLKKADKVVRVEKKGKAYFRLPTAEDTATE